MNILKVIHGYPMRYNAGSEVYSQTLCQELADRHQVNVFTREEDPFLPDAHLRVEQDDEDNRITLHLVNNPRFKDRYRSDAIDRQFVGVLDRVCPDLVHIGHLNHLSTSLVQEASSRGVPIVFTLHDYWLMCPRGQFMQMFPEAPADLWAACGGQEDRYCAERCYARYFSGAPDEIEADVAYWAGWIERRMRHVREMTELVDLFIAPSRYLLERYRDAFGLPDSKLVHLDYGFARDRMEGRSRIPGEPFTFGYIGTHIPAKGIHDLIRAFGMIQGEARLRIWGRPRGQETVALQAFAAGLPAGVAERIEWLLEYSNQAIVAEVFNRCDAIVVPSIWVENSPLVIHEAQQARVPVITADAGGMAEFVQQEVNGLLFEHRSYSALARQMQRLADDPELSVRLGARGYLYSPSGDVPGIDAHVRRIEELYEGVISSRNAAKEPTRTAPWRITFDTNPDMCNLQCIMCEEHSPLRLQKSQQTASHPEQRIMPFDMIERIVAETAPLGLREIIPSTMGEPLLYPRFADILDLCARHGVKLNLTTNGTFPGLGAEVWGELIVPVASDVKISWNGGTKQTYEEIMSGQNWERALESVRTFIVVRDRHAATGGNRCSVTFQLTFLERNVAELADMVRLAVSLGVDRVKGHHLWVHYDEMRSQSIRRSPESVRRWNEAVDAALAAAAERCLPNGQPILLENIFPLNDTAAEDIAPGGRCPFIGQEAWVSAQGRFNPCCAPDALRRSLGDFGSLSEHSFMALWSSETYRELQVNYQHQDLCRGCNMRRPKGGTI